MTPRDATPKEAKSILKKRECPFCGAKEFEVGPSGGGQMYRCDCGGEFTIYNGLFTPSIVQEPSHV